MESQWLTVEYIARDLQVSETTVRGWIRDKKLRGAKFGRDYRVRRDDYEDFIKRHLDKEDVHDND